MGKMVHIKDSLVNLIANLNTSRDKQSSAQHVVTVLAPAQLLNIYRTSWMARKIVDIPAKDATRKWREWQADKAQTEALQKEEKRLGLQNKIKMALGLGRLYGGAAIYIGIEGDDARLPLDPKAVKKGGISYINVLSRQVLNTAELEADPLEDRYNKPKFYTVSSTGNAQEIHPSRLAIFLGGELPDPDNTASEQQGWSDSVLISAYDAIQNADSIAANIGSLVYEAKVDILKIPGLTDMMAEASTRKLLVDRVELSGQLKGNNGMLIIDGEEEYQSKTFNFAGLPDIQRQALQNVSGSADIPITRFLGQSPAGLSSTGESDLKNYYDSVASMQTLEITPAIAILDECVINSALGTRPEDVDYTWRSLWQMDDDQKSRISKETAETIKILNDTRLFHEDDLAEAAANMLVEHSIMPTLEITQHGEGEPEETGASVDAVDATTPRTLYIGRKVINAADIVTWAEAQGFTGILQAAELHVTIAYSRTPVDWLKVGRDWNGDDSGRVRIPPGGPRVVEAFGDAKVLGFASNELQWRNKSIIKKGASWDWDDYTPRITISHDAIPKDAEPYRGPIVLGPEIFKEIKE